MNNLQAFIYKLVNMSLPLPLLVTTLSRIQFVHACQFMFVVFERVPRSGRQTRDLFDLRLYLSQLQRFRPLSYCAPQRLIKS